MQKSSGLVDVGRITTAFGVQGWVKIRSETEPPENLFSYSPWFLKTRHGVKEVEVVSYKTHGPGFVALIKGVESREQAEALNRVVIAIDKTQMPQLPADEYYWHQLQGVRVYCDVDGVEVCLGTVSHLMETGANDVLVVKGDDDSLDLAERLIPYVPGQFVKQVDLQSSRMLVDWDPEF